MIGWQPRLEPHKRLHSRANVLLTRARHLELSHPLPRPPNLSHHLRKLRLRQLRSAGWTRRTRRRPARSALLLLEARYDNPWWRQRSLGLKLIRAALQSPKGPPLPLRHAQLLQQCGGQRRRHRLRRDGQVAHHLEKHPQHRPHALRVRPLEPPRRLHVDVPVAALSEG